MEERKAKIRTFLGKHLGGHTLEDDEDIFARGFVNMTLPWFDVHQNADNFLMNGGRNGQEEVGSESTVHR